MASTLVFTTFLTLVALASSYINLGTIRSAGTHRMKIAKNVMEMVVKDESATVAHNTGEPGRLIFSEFIDMIEPGMSARMTISVKERFSIYISNNEDKNIAILISVRPDEKVMVFNAQFNGVWDTEERRLIPFNIPSDVIIQLNVFEDFFECIFNESYRKHFFHRLPLEGNGFLRVTGAASVEAAEVWMMDEEDDDENEWQGEDKEGQEDGKELYLNDYNTYE